MNHWISPRLACSSRANVGRATLTIVPSIVITIRLTHSTASVRQRALSGRVGMNTPGSRIDKHLAGIGRERAHELGKADALPSQVDQPLAQTAGQRSAELA